MTENAGFHAKEVSSTGYERNLKSLRRGRWKFLVGAGIIAALGVTFAGLTLQALNIRAHTSSEFSAYVANHNLGTVELVDDESGVQTDFAVLHLRQPLAGSMLEQQTLDLMKTYFTLDGGSHLTIEYSANGKTDVLSDAVLLPGQSSRTLAITLHENGQVQVVKESVDWGSGTTGS